MGKSWRLKNLSAYHLTILVMGIVKVNPEITKIHLSKWNRLKMQLVILEPSVLLRTQKSMDLVDAPVGVIFPWSLLQIRDWQLLHQSKSLTVQGYLKISALNHHSSPLPLSEKLKLHFSRTAFLSIYSTSKIPE